MRLFYFRIVQWVLKVFVHRLKQDNFFKLHRKVGILLGKFIFLVDARKEFFSKIAIRRGRTESSKSPF